MAITLEQDVAYKEMPAGTDWIFTISSTNYSGNYKFKYIADLWIDVGTPGALSIRLKFSPNSTGNGIIDISKILEQYVSSDNLGSEAVVFSNFKGTSATATTQHPIHLTDEFSIATNSAKRLTIRWGEEYSANATDAPTEYPNILTSSNYFFWNAVSYNNEQRLVSGEYGINVSDWNDRIFTLNTSISNCLTDASADRQYIGDNEYSTLAYLNGWYSTGVSTLDRMQITFKDADNNQISVITTDVIAGNGGYDGSSDTGLVDANKKYNSLE